ncbi:MAG: hypothetical protein SF339_18290 [Blastocatellia bacterium]|nr:hypothetical protein [Blastocatellia bacterium]
MTIEDVEDVLKTQFADASPEALQPIRDIFAIGEQCGKSVDEMLDVLVAYAREHGAIID